ncbi:MAG: SMC-Scp complex subunit ScpB [Rhodospirillaceae bacterium]|nr:SMC-Scp complex subunit ScpB [Rhodospirillaceae bacterium]
MVEIAREIIEDSEPDLAQDGEEEAEFRDYMAEAADMTQELRIVEALLFAATEPISTDFLAERLPEGTDIGAILSELGRMYEGRGVNLTRVAGKWSLRTAEDLSAHLRIERKVSRKPSRAAVESLAIIAYHQPVTRSEVEEIRGVSVSKGSFDVLLEAGWIKPVGRRRTPGRPTTWGTTQAFLEEFGLDSLADLPGIDELKASGLLDTRPAGTIIGDTGQIYEDATAEGAPGGEVEEGLDPADGEPPVEASVEATYQADKFEEERTAT